MEYKQTVKWGTIFFVALLLLTVVSAAIATLGVSIGGLRLVGYYYSTPEWLRLWFYPRAGFGVIVLGGIFWCYGATLLFYYTFAILVQEQTSGQLDTETLKSDILAVLDDRLADMHQETTQTRRLIDRISREDAASDFDFDDEFTD